jgi:hypothetical protein
MNTCKTCYPHWTAPPVDTDVWWWHNKDTAYHKMVQRFSEMVEDLLVVDRTGRSIMSVTGVYVAREEELWNWVSYTFEKSCGERADMPFDRRHSRRQLYVFAIEWFIDTYGEKKRCKITVHTQLYLCANQLHISAMYSHHRACVSTVILHLSFLLMYM